MKATSKILRTSSLVGVAFLATACGVQEPGAADSRVMSVSTLGAEAVSTSAKDLGGPIVLDGKIALDQFFRHNTGTDVTTSGGTLRADFKLTANLSEKVRLVLRTKISENLQTKQVLPADFEGWPKEAYVEIHDVGGEPVAFIIGKHPIAFGAKVPFMPVPEDDPAFKLQRVEEVMGVTVALGKTGFFDLIELSAFENEPGDLQIGDINGASVRFTKNVTKQLVVRASAMHAGNDASSDENRAGIGLLYSNGLWSVWVDGALKNGGVLYPNSHWYGVAGVKYGNAQRSVTVQASVIENSLWEVGLGAQLEVLKNTYMIPEIRYRETNGIGEVIGTMRLEYRFSIK